jgi:hypothetical protein
MKAFFIKTNINDKLINFKYNVKLKLINYTSPDSFIDVLNYYGFDFERPVIASLPPKMMNNTFRVRKGNEIYYTYIKINNESYFAVSKL